MATNIGVKLTAEGEKEFKKALREVNTQLKTADTELKLVASQYDKTDNSMAATEARTKAINKATDAENEKLGILETQLEKVSAEYGENSEQAQKLQQQINLTKTEINKLGNSLEDITEDTKEAADEAEEYGEKTNNAGKVASAAFVAIAAAVVAATKALTDCTTAAASFADTVLTESTVTGIATDKLQEYMYAAELVDVSTETLTSSMTKNIRSMKLAIDGTKTYAEAYERLNVAVTNTDGSMRDSDTVYWELIDALGEIENETERDALAMTVLGKSAQDLNPLIEAGSEKMAELGEQAQAAGYVMDEATLSSFGAFDDQLQYLSVNAEAAKNALGQLLLPVLQSLAGEGNGFLTEFTNIANEEGIPGIVSFISEKIPVVLGEVLNKVAEVLPDAIVTFLDIIDQLFNENLDTITKDIINCIVDLLEGVIERLPQIINSVLSIIKTIVEVVIDNLPIIIDAIMEMIPMLCEAIVNSLPDILAAIVELVWKIIQSIPTILESLWNSIIDTFIGGFSDAISGTVSSAKSSLRETAGYTTRTTTTTASSLESLMAEQNAILETIAEKDNNTYIGDVAIAQASARYESTKGITIASGGLSNAY